MKSLPVADIYFSWEAMPFSLPPPPGAVFMNPSIARTDDGYLCNIRCARFEERRIFTKNLLCCFTKNLFRGGDYIVSSEYLEIPEDFPNPPNLMFNGIEDIRLFFHGNLLRGIAATWHMTAGQCASMVLLTIATDGGKPRIVEWRALPSPVPGRHEKNWIPFIKDGTNMFVYSIEPTRIFSESGAEISRSRLPNASLGLARNLRGSSQMIPFQDGYLAVVHETEIPKERIYFHRFVYFNAAASPVAMTQRFHFLNLGEEFVTGLCHMHGHARVVLSYSSGDAVALFGTVKTAEIWSKLIPIV